MSTGGADRVWTVEDLLVLHPWPAVAAQAGERRLEWFWHYDVPVAPDALWRVINPPQEAQLERASVR